MIGKVGIREFLTLYSISMSFMPVVHGGGHAIVVQIRGHVSVILRFLPDPVGDFVDVKGQSQS
jgi:hypothetical protein